MKGKIISTSNKPKTLWLYLEKSEDILERLYNILSKFYNVEADSFKDYDLRVKIDPESYGENGSLSSEDVTFLPVKYEEYIGKVFYFFEDKPLISEEDEALYLFFKEKEILAILRKDSPKFEALRKAFLEEFEFIDNDKK